MPRSPVTNVINGFNALTEDEKKLCLDFIAPEPEPEPQVKQTRKKRTTKSAKAQSLSSAIAKVPKADSEAGSVTLDADTPNCGICGNPEDHADHDRTYLKSHDFEAPKSVASAAKRSSRKGAAANNTQSIETNSEGALAVGASGD